MGSKIITPERWRRIGLEIGRERGQLDRIEGKVIAPEELWLPDNAHPAYIAALKEAYREAVSGAPSSLEI